jgi:hypothetical protein
MSNSAVQAFITKFTDSVEFLVQQMPARLWQESEIRGEAPGSGAVAVEQFGKVSMQQVTQRLQPIQFTDTPQTRRWVYPTPYFLADAVDTFEKLEMAIDPDGWIAKTQVFAANRQKDDTFVSAFFGTAQTATTSANGGNAPATAVTFPAGQIISVNCGSSGFTGSPVTGSGGTATGMNVPKLRGARLIMAAQEVDLDMEMPNVAMSATQLDNMLNQAHAISLDFNETPVLVDGKITRFMGFRFIHSERLPGPTVQPGSPTQITTYRQNPVWVKSGMRGAIWQDITTDIRQRTDLVGYPWQVSVEQMIGATRLQEYKCVQINSAES